jgi:hypothetical protein
VNETSPVHPIRPSPLIVIEWGGEIFTFASAEEALKAGFHVPKDPEEKPHA